ncbi:hypothetical protein EDC90_102348 [Martelella mediterranea]|uniref:Uncharacterized protein n=2 Tax=Martelella mediterranea TaxID=293089 RepID=A0A4R3NNE6_9HYPH|nr:hypothetical protein EDC90_102348 [Martelella mediterranea]
MIEPDYTSQNTARTRVPFPSDRSESLARRRMPQLNAQNDGVHSATAAPSRTYVDASQTIEPTPQSDDEARPGPSGITPEQLQRAEHVYNASLMRRSGGEGGLALQVVAPPAPVVDAQAGGANVEDGDNPAKHIQKLIGFEGVKQQIFFQKVKTFDAQKSIDLREALSVIGTYLKADSASRANIEKLEYKVFNCIENIKKNRKDVVNLLNKQQNHKKEYYLDFRHHLAGKTSVGQFFARSATSSVLSSVIGAALQFMYAANSANGCQEAAETIRQQSNATDIGTLECRTSDFIGSAYLPADASAGVAVGADFIIGMSSGTLSGIVSGKNELDLQQQNRLNRLEQREGARTTSLQRMLNTAHNVVLPHLVNVLVRVVLDTGINSIAGSAGVVANLGRATAIHSAAEGADMAIDIVRDGFFHDSSEASRYWGKIAAQIMLPGTASQAVRSAIDGEGPSGYLRNILSYGIVSSALRKIPSVTLYNWREKNIPVDEKQGALNFRLCLLVGQLLDELDPNKLKAAIKPSRNQAEDEAALTSEVENARKLTLNLVNQLRNTMLKTQEDSPECTRATESLHQEIEDLNRSPESDVASASTLRRRNVARSNSSAAPSGVSNLSQALSGRVDATTPRVVSARDVVIEMNELPASASGSMRDTTVSGKRAQADISSASIQSDDDNASVFDRRF